jgi:hypothetical protein
LISLAAGLIQTRSWPPELGTRSSVTFSTSGVTCTYTTQSLLRPTDSIVPGRGILLFQASVLVVPSGSALHCRQRLYLAASAEPARRLKHRSMGRFPSDALHNQLFRLGPFAHRETGLHRQKQNLIAPVRSHLSSLATCLHITHCSVK